MVAKISKILNEDSLRGDIVGGTESKMVYYDCERVFSLLECWWKWYWRKREVGELIGIHDNFFFLMLLVKI